MKFLLIMYLLSVIVNVYLLHFTPLYEFLRTMLPKQEAETLRKGMNYIKFMPLFNTMSAIAFTIVYLKLKNL